MADDKFAEKLETLKKTVEEQQSTKITKLPFWTELKRGTPNSFLRSALFSAIQSKDRVFVKNEIIFSQQGIKITFTGEQLNQEDLSLWEALVHFYKEQPLGNEVNFTSYRILKLLDLDTGGRDQQRLHEGIKRLAACLVEITHNGRRFFDSLVKSGRLDETTTSYTLELSKKLIQIFGDDQWTAIDWKQRLELRRKPLAQALHAYYSSHKTPYPVKLNFLQQLTGSRNSQPASFKRHVCTALDALVAIGFLQSYGVDVDLARTFHKFGIPAHKPQSLCFCDFLATNPLPPVRDEAVDRLLERVGGIVS